MKKYYNSKALSWGRAGEHLVCADLLSRGYEVCLAPAGSCFDIIAVVDNKILKIQVKTTHHMKKIKQKKGCPFGYQFNARKRGKLGRKEYTKHDYDIMAFVALDINQIAYLVYKKCYQTMHFRPKESKGKNRYDLYLKRKSKAKKLRLEGKNFKQIAKILKVSCHCVGTYFRRNPKNYAKNYSNYKYINEFPFNKALKELK